jgi:LysM repeat protein
MSWYSLTDQRTKPQPRPLEAVEIPATLEAVMAEPVTDVPLPTSQFKPAKYKSGDTYRWKAGDNIWQVARDMGITTERLMEFNDIEDPNELEPGIIIYFPTPSKQPDRLTTYEVFPAPVPMHVIKEGGCKKYAFGNAKVWGDIVTVGPRYTEDANVNVAGVASVPLIDENGQDVTAKFLMDRLALGLYAETGQVAWDIGFNHTHLTDGHVERQAPKPRIDIQQTIAAVPLGKQVMDVAATVDYLKADLMSYKTSLRPIYADRRVVTYFCDVALNARDHDGMRPDHPLVPNEAIRAQYEFIHDDITYVRPINTKYWFGIPKDLLTEEDDVMSYGDVTLSDRAALRSALTPMEKYVVVPISRLLNNKWLKDKIEKYKQGVRHGRG